MSTETKEAPKSIFQKIRSLSHVKLDEYISKARGLKESETERMSIDYDPWSRDEGVGYSQRPTRINYKHLDIMSKKDGVIAAILTTRINQVASFSRKQTDKYELGYSIQHKDKKKELTDELNEKIEKLYDFIDNTGFVEDSRPDDEKMKFEEFLRRIVRDRLVFDQVGVEKVKSRDGKLSYFTPVDGATLRLASRKEPTTAYLKPYDDKKRDDVEYAYVQVINETIFKAFTRDDLMFRMANLTNNIECKGYSISELELLVALVTSHLNAESYNKKFFTQGFVQKGILHFKANISQRKLNMFKKAWYAQTSGVFNSWRTPVLAGMEDVRWIPLGQNNRDIEFHLWMEYCIKLICAIYLIDPSEINFDITQSRPEGNPMFTSKNEHLVKQSKDRGLRPLLRFIEDIMNDLLGEITDEFEFRFVGLDVDSKKDEVERYGKEVETHKTVNEIRKENNLDPIDLVFTVGDKKIAPYDIPLQPQAVQLIQALVQNTAQQQQMSPTSPGGPSPIEDGGPEGGEEISSIGEEQKQPPQQVDEEDQEEPKPKKPEEREMGNYQPEEEFGKSRALKIEYYQIVEKKSEERLQKGKAFPVGTTRKWGNQEYVKHSDGWVTVGGKSHGKIIDKDGKLVHDHVNQKSHKELADGQGQKKDEPVKEQPKISEKADELYHKYRSTSGKEREEHFKNYLRALKERHEGEIAGRKEEPKKEFEIDPKVTAKDFDEKTQTVLNPMTNNRVKLSGLSTKYINKYLPQLKKEDGKWVDTSKKKQESEVDKMKEKVRKLVGLPSEKEVKENQKKIDEYKKKIKDLQDQLKDSVLEPHDIKEIESDIGHLQDGIRNLESKIPQGRSEPKKEEPSKSTEEKPKTPWTTTHTVHDSNGRTVGKVEKNKHGSYLATIEGYATHSPSEDREGGHSTPDRALADGQKEYAEYVTRFNDRSSSEHQQHLSDMQQGHSLKPVKDDMKKALGKSIDQLIRDTKNGN